MNTHSDTPAKLPLNRLGSLAAGALLAGLLLHQVLPAPTARAAEADRAALKPAAEVAFREAKPAEAGRQAAAVEAANLADAKGAASGAVPPAAPTPSPPPKPKGGHSNGSPVKELMGMSIGFVAVVMGIGIGMLVIWTEHRKRLTLMQLCHQERMAALEKGLELPPFSQDMLKDAAETREAEAPETGLKGGLIWLALGIGLGLFLGLQPKPYFHPALSAVPIALGLAYLAYYAIAGRKLPPPGH